MSGHRTRYTIVIMKRSDIDETVREIWTTRPHRRRADRKIAGVAAAIARRYGIDPILVRIALVVATIYGGVGVLVYLLGWLLLPEEGDEVSAAESLLGQGQSSMSKPLTIVLSLALIPAGSAIFTAQISALLAIGMVAAAVYLLHRNRAGMAVTAPGATTGLAGGVNPAASPPQQPVTPAQQPTVPDSADEHPQTQQPPAWDPLGVAPFAWDLPEPQPAPPPVEPPRPARRRSAVTAVTLALALIAVGVASIVALSGDLIGPQEVAAIALGVVGVGLVVGSFVRGGRGLIAVAIPLAIVTYAMSLTPVDTIDGVGERHWQAATAAELQPQYRLSIGNANLDLRELRLADGEQVRTEVHVGLGELIVTLPPNADVQIECDAGAGEVTCLDAVSNGVRAVERRTDLGLDGEGGGTIILTAKVGTGNVQVNRG